MTNTYRHRSDPWCSASCEGCFECSEECQRCCDSRRSSTLDENGHCPDCVRDLELELCVGCAKVVGIFDVAPGETYCWMCAMGLVFHVLGAA
jgi:hypothetical protein